jgi:hypothetical protein
MQRRTAVKYLFVVAAGSAVLPACLHKKDKTSIALKHLDIDAEQEKLLAEISETIIPAGAAPGAKDTYAHLFALRMMDDCFEQQKQQSFVKGLNEVNKMSREKFGATFLKCSNQQRNEIVNALETKNASREALDFYSMMKNLTIQGYLTAKPVLGDIFKFELVPGRYNGFFPVKTITHQA